MIRWMQQARAKDRQIYTCDNEGSPSTATHFVADIVKTGAEARVNFETP